MIADADRTALNYLETKVASVTVHFEACGSPKELLRKIRGAGKRSGLAIKPDTPFSEIENLIEDLDMLLIMTVEPGFGGQSFIEAMVPKIEKARKWLDAKELNSTWLQVDGGINLETIKTARKAGADTFVAGSVVYKSDNPAAVIDNLRKLANEE
jgi:ribulose-phosphate 3-epimerase